MIKKQYTDMEKWGENETEMVLKRSGIKWTE